MYIKQIMTTNIIRARADMQAYKLADLFVEHNINHLPVVDDGEHLIGILSDRDVSKHISPFVDTEREREQDRDSLLTTAEDLMSSSPITITEDSRIDTASILLLENNFSCLPVMCDDDDTLVGIVTWKDILDYYIYSDNEA